MDVTLLSAAHKALVNLGACILGQQLRQSKEKLIQQVINLSTYEGADLDISIPIVLFYSYHADGSEWFVKNLLESIGSYPQEKIELVVQSIREIGSIYDPTKSTIYTAIVHDAIILTSLDQLITNTGKAMIAEKSGLLRMLSSHMKDKLSLR